MSYTDFAQYYDGLMQNAGYPERAEYLCALLRHFHHEPGETLDLACGTGTLTLELKKRGFSIFGVDASVDMLTQAQAKAADCGEQILFLHQRMQRLELFGTVDTVLCTLDSLNHLATPQDVQETFVRVARYLEPGGLFIFDMNTPYKHREILGDNIFLYDTDEVYCIWQNHYQSSGCRVHITLDFFARDGALYRRSGESFFERAYETEQIHAFLQKAGLRCVGTFAEQSFQPPAADTQRIVYVAQKPNF